MQATSKNRLVAAISIIGMETITGLVEVSNLYSFFVILLRKMIKNRWLVASQFFGVLVIASILSSIPAYVNGVLQRILQKELQSFQVKTLKYPGSVEISLDSSYNTTKWDISKYDNVEKLYNELPQLIPLPEISRAKFISNEISI
ncbi:MAG: hypothetical protein Q7J78_04720 [Clostridiales bacterium]|nr:hypothetical protein [Clostridiales bacterium]